MSTLVKDVMTTKVIWVNQDTRFAAIAAALREYRISAFPVLDDAGRVLGVVSESDLLAKLALGGGEDRMPGMITGILRQHQMEKARAVTAGHLMTSPAVTVSPDDAVERAAKLMYLHKVKRLPVVTADNQLAGIVGRADVLAVYDRADEEIGEEIRDGIAVRESLTDAERFDVSVTDGVVTLAGRPRTCGQGHDVVRHARHVQGVVAVRDRLDYPPPETDEIERAGPHTGRGTCLSEQLFIRTKRCRLSRHRSTARARPKPISAVPVIRSRVARTRRDRSQSRIRCTSPTTTSCQAAPATTTV
ncbi:MAG: CBS domain-containing protein [Nocardiopsaceae bacterium]|nr:CBS domain-containing protein [Nocardiopsaceae bacterium]